ncbi:MAG: hypothetical protein OQJ89_01730 [Kangiellaceae bacterium]|nr:hypothetical protein [Kangiellaceae bacterium]MCW9015663.1 hypothetical protein [Kangiellaceae bacterium]
MRLTYPYMETIDSTQLARQLWQFCQQNDIEFDRFSYSLQQAYLPLLTQLYHKYQSRQKQPFILGINGAQGSGKTTLANLLNLLFHHCFNLKVVNFSIDDLYLSKKQREELAQNIHPLFATRGVPGTHNIHLGIELFEKLASATNESPVFIPSFDKAVDDLKPRVEWPMVNNIPDIIIFEGWCVGSKPQMEQELSEPVNSLEADEDNQMIWRQTVNDKLADDYQKLFSMIDCLVFLKAPNFDIVYQWRCEQEKQLRNKVSSNKNLAPSQAMNDSQIRSFILFFERLTQHNLKTLSSSSDIVLELNKYRSPKSLRKSD